MIRQKATRRPTAAALPPKTAILRCVSGSERVARAITTALSPDNRMSMLVIRSRSTKNRAAPNGTRVRPHFPLSTGGRRNAPRWPGERLHQRDLVGDVHQDRDRPT